MPGLITTLKNDLNSDKRDNVQWHDEIEFYVDGEIFTTQIFLFKNKSAADTYRKDEGVIFTYNGQCHAMMTKDFSPKKREERLPLAFLVDVCGLQRHQRAVP